MASLGERVSRDAMLLLGLLTGLGQAAGFVVAPPDAVNYWNSDLRHLYPTSWGDWQERGLLYYPPLVAQAFGLLHALGWRVFVTLWTTALFAAFWYCARVWSLPLVLAGVVPLVGGPDHGLAPFLVYALNGNIQWLLAAAAVMAIDRPMLWAVQLATKITTGVGVIWYIVRGEWTVLARIVALAAVILSVSISTAPQAWLDFVAFVVRNATFADPPIPQFPVPFPARAATAVLLVAWGARTTRRWVLPVAAGWALPALYGLGFLPFWIGPICRLVHPAGTLEPAERDASELRTSEPRTRNASAASHVIGMWLRALVTRNRASR